MIPQPPCLRVRYSQSSCEGKDCGVNRKIIYRKFGTTNMRLSALGIGTNRFKTSARRNSKLYRSCQEAVEKSGIKLVKLHRRVDVPWQY
jgi:hypothetical protein